LAFFHLGIDLDGLLNLVQLCLQFFDFLAEFNGNRLVRHAHLLNGHLVL